MVRALLYLRLTSLGNLLRSRLLRLRQPKYLVGAIVGAAYFYFMFFRQVRESGVIGGPMANGFPAALMPAVAAIGALALLVIAALSWIVPNQRAGLAFSEAEIAFLFPAPVTRRKLIHYKLLSSQAAILFTALVFTLISRRWSFLGGNTATHAVGWWLVLATLNLHFIGSSFVITRLLDRGITPWRRRLAVLGGIALVVIGTGAWIWHDLRAPQAADLADVRAMVAYLGGLLAHGPLAWLLLPARAVLGPFLAPNTAAFFLALAPAALVFAAHYAWILRAEVSFEDASIAKAEKRAAKVAAIREGNWRAARSAVTARPAPFRLGPAGRPEAAFLWKNLLSTHTVFRPRVFPLVAGGVIALCLWLGSQADAHGVLLAVAVAAMIVGSYTLFLGPQIARQDLRGDLLNADLLKTYPLRGWQIVLGEMLTPVAILTGLLWLVLLAVALAFQPRGIEWLTVPVRTVIAVCLALVTPLICALQLLVPNAATLLFPAWMHSMRNRTERGIEVMGQRLIFVAGQFLVVLAALLPALLVAAVLIFASQWLIGPAAAVVLATVPVLAILAAEIWLGVHWLGTRFERFDLSSELRP
jgi:hypothetical protein